MYTNLEAFLVQINEKKGIEKDGMRSIQSILQEFTQFYGKQVVAPINLDTLSHEEINKCLRAINLIIEKRNGRLKARTYTDEHKQRSYITKEESSSRIRCQQKL